MLFRSVSVLSDGKQVKDFSTTLVHHVELSLTEYRNITASWPKQLNLPFEAAMEFDRRGKPMGLRIANIRGNAGSALGLLNKDIITAIGLSCPTGPRDLWAVFDELRTQRKASITLERAGRPHKIFYYLSSTNAKHAG